MATLGKSVEAASPHRIEGYPADSRRFDWLAILTSAWFIGGLFLDGWAHNHIPSLETFFTPWHGVLYSGFFSVAILMAVTQYRNIAKGYAWGRALPKGYFLSLVGVAIFFAGGVSDMLWHTILGVEQNAEALFSPPHLLLASSAILFLAGPLRAAWGRKVTTGWADLAPAILSLTMLFSLFTFFTQYANFYGNPSLLVGRGGSANDYLENVTTIANLLFPAAITVGVLLFALRRWRLPFGTVTFMLTVNAALMVLMRFRFASAYWPVIVSAALTGLLADVLIARLRPSAANPLALRAFAFAVPFAQSLLALAAIVLTRGQPLWWEVHMWLGVPFVAGVIGVGVSFLVAPPPVPAET
jgi:hypothetical protein